MRTYTQLTREQRYQLSALLKMGHSQTEIAEVIGMHKSTISREIRRNRGQRGYRPKQAHYMAKERRNKPAPRIQVETWELIESKLRDDWSPEQISGRLKRDKDIQVSHESIYLYILADKRAGGDLHKHLRCQNKRRKRYGSYDRRGKPPNRVSIDERPGIVDRRQRVGDWEVDTIIGKGHRQAVVTLTERKSCFVLLRIVKHLPAILVNNVVIDLLQQFMDRSQTITGAKGKECAEHEQIIIDLDIDLFFTQTNTAWALGANEYMNGLIRHYVPKNRDFASVTDDELLLIITWLKLRPGKCLYFRTQF